MTDAYRDDLAYIHDAGFGALARHAATALIADLNDRSMLSGTVVDLGCGSGITAEVLADAGYHVLGVDLSEPLIRIARARVPTAEFRVGSFVDMEIPPCIAVTAIGEVLNYLFDPHNGESARSPLFNKIYAALRPSGLFMFDLATPKRKPEGGVSRSFTESTDWTVLVQIDAEPDSNILRRQITTFEG